MQQRAGLVHEVVAGGAVYRPACIQHFSISQDFFHDEIGRGIPGVLRAGVVKLLTQAPQVRARAGQAIDVVDAQPVQHAFPNQLQRQRMHGVEDFVVFHTHAHQFADFEEAPPVDLLGRGAPPREPVMLAFQQIMQTRRAVRRAIRCAVRCAVRCAGIKRRADGSGVIPSRSRAGGQGQMLSARFDGIAISGRGVVNQSDVAGGQRLAIRLAQHRQQHFAVQRCVSRLPVDVERAGVAALRAMPQHIGPPRVRGVGGHVVGHDVGNQPQAVPVRRVGQPAQRGLAAQFRIDALMVNDVVTMR